MRWRWHPPLPGCVRGEGLDWPGAQPVPRPTPGAMEGVPWPRFSWIYTYAESGWNVPRKAGKRAAHSREAGAKGGRPKKAAAADAVLQQPAADKARRRASRQIGFASTTPALFSSANARSYARALLVGECPHDSPPAPGILFPALFPLFCLHLLPSLCSKQSRERKQLFVAALFASFVCCSCVYQNLAFINAVYLKKRNREGRRSSCRRSTKKARQQQHRQHLR